MIPRAWCELSPSPDPTAPFHCLCMPSVFLLAVRREVHALLCFGALPRYQHGRRPIHPLCGGFWSLLVAKHSATDNSQIGHLVRSIHTSQLCPMITLSSESPARRKRRIFLKVASYFRRSALQWRSHQRKQKQCPMITPRSW